MRKILHAAQARDKAGELFRGRLASAGHKSVKTTSWTLARLTYAGVSQKEITDETVAARLARRIGARLTDRLSRNPAVTARALEIYDPELPGQLMEAWKRENNITREDAL
jgi:hypothetical protein